jgi:hypothetical protein
MPESPFSAGDSSRSVGLLGGDLVAVADGDHGIGLLAVAQVADADGGSGMAAGDLFDQSLPSLMGRPSME